MKQKREEMDESFKEMRANLRIAREELESKEKEQQRGIFNPKYEELSNEWITEKNSLISKIESLQKQNEENKLVQEVLVNALQAKVPVVQQKSNRSNEELDDRYLRLEEQVEKLKNMQNLVNNSSALQCKFCGETISSKLFNSHLTICGQQHEENILDPAQYSIVVVQSMVKDPADQKPFTEYVISVTYKGMTWTVTKRYKALCNLHSSLQKDFPDIQLPNTENLFLSNASSSSLFSTKRPVVLDERRRACQQYLMDLAAIPAIKNSSIFKDFLSGTQNFGDESPVKTPNKYSIQNSLRKSGNIDHIDYTSPEDRYR